MDSSVKKKLKYRELIPGTPDPAPTIGPSGPSKCDYILSNMFFNCKFRRGDPQIHSGTAPNVPRPAVHQPSVRRVQELRKVRRSCNRHQQPTDTRWFLCDTFLRFTSRANYRSWMEIEVSMMGSCFLVCGIGLFIDTSNYYELVDGCCF